MNAPVGTANKSVSVSIPEISPKSNAVNITLSTTDNTTQKTDKEDKPKTDDLLQKNNAALNSIGSGLTVTELEKKLNTAILNNTPPLTVDKVLNAVSIDDILKDIQNEQVKVAKEATTVAKKKAEEKAEKDKAANGDKKPPANDPLKIDIDKSVFSEPHGNLETQAKIASDKFRYDATRQELLSQIQSMATSHARNLSAKSLETANMIGAYRNKMFELFNEKIDAIYNNTWKRIKKIANGFKW